MEDFKQAFDIVKRALPADCISQDREDLITRGSSSWTYHDPRVLPGAVLYPRNTDDVGIMRKCVCKSYVLISCTRDLRSSWAPVLRLQGGGDCKGDTRLEF